jgi:hypothetical protein
VRSRKNLCELSATSVNNLTALVETFQFKRVKTIDVYTAPHKKIVSPLFYGNYISFPVSQRHGISWLVKVNGKPNASLPKVCGKFGLNFFFVLFNYIVEEGVVKVFL